MTAAHKSSLEDFLVLAIEGPEIDAVWTLGSWEEWYCAASKSRMRMDGKPAPFDILGMQSGANHHKVKLVFRSDPKLTLVTFTTTEAPGTGQEILEEMLRALQE